MNEYLHPNSPDEDEKIFAHLRVGWKKNHDQAWAEVAARLQQKPARRTTLLRPTWAYTAAALLAIGLFLGIGMRSYTRQVSTQTAQHTQHLLPDGSRVSLNAASSLSYRPLWWWASREVQLQGEAFFEVKHGSAFRVQSAQGSTQVLGTEFNVLSRKAQYEVTCLSGRVQVSSPQSATLLLSAAQKASLDSSGQLHLQQNVNPDNARAWLQQRLVFTALPLHLVIEEIERQFAVSVQLPPQLNELYTGNIDRTLGVETCLQIVARPFGLRVLRESPTRFRLQK